jgi:DNA-directed RNA polymerase sigma subunit (sigma70/sigma32)
MAPSLKAYLDEARAAESVIQDEPAMLELARSGDVEAQQTLIRAYLYRAATTALRLAPEGMAGLDAIQEANVLLKKVVTKAPGPSVARDLEAAIRNRFGTLG